MSGFSFRPAGFGAIAGWAEDDMRRAFAAFRRSAVRAVNISPYRQAKAAPPPAFWEPVYRRALAIDPEIASAEAARSFFQGGFRAWEVVPAGPANSPANGPVNGPANGPTNGKVTAYYEPVVPARRRPDERFRFPFLRRPAHLVKIEDPDDPPPGVPKGFAFALDTGAGPEICPDRQAIETGAFRGQGLEIAWAEDKGDVFFAHVQGSARLDLGEGEAVRITYAAKSGHPFTGIGGLLVEGGEISRADISMQSIRRWLKGNPDRADALMWRNRSFIFFEEVPVPDETLGPVAAAKVPLEPGRSLAVDRLIHSFGTPVFVSAPELADFDGGGPFRRLMIAQDTGSAIVGPARGDLFAGSGDEAGRLAGAVNAVATFHLLLPENFDPAAIGVNVLDEDG